MREQNIKPKKLRKDGKPKISHFTQLMPKVSIDLNNDNMKKALPIKGIDRIKHAFIDGGHPFKITKRFEHVKDIDQGAIELQLVPQIY